MEDKMRATYNKDKTVDHNNINLDVNSEDEENEPEIVKKKDSGDEINGQNGNGNDLNQTS